MATKTPDGMIKFRVRITRIVIKESYWFSDKIVLRMYRAQDIGKSLAPKLDWGEVDSLSYSVLAEPWFLGVEKKKKRPPQDEKTFVVY